MAKLLLPRLSVSTAATIKRSSRPLVTLGNMTNGGFSTHFLSILKLATPWEQAIAGARKSVSWQAVKAFKLPVAMSRAPLGGGARRTTWLTGKMRHSKPTRHEPTVPHQPLPLMRD